MRTINNIVLHCTATPQTAKVENIVRYWKEELGWKKPGYHHIIKADGQIVDLLPIEQPSNGVQGFNSDSIHISYIGGVDGKGNAVDNRTDAQKQAQIKLIKLYKQQFPNAQIKGHRDFPGVAKSCPSFDVGEWLNCIGIH